MAIAQFKKIEILGHAVTQSAVITSLHTLGMVELREHSFSHEEGSHVSGPLPSVYDQYKAQRVAVEHALAFLDQYEEKKGLMDGILSQKPLFDAVSLETLIKTLDVQALCSMLTQREQTHEELSKRIHYCNAERELLYPWRNLPLPLSYMQPTALCTIAAGTLLVKDFVSFQESMASYVHHIEVLHQDTLHVYGIIIFFKEDQEAILGVLKTHNFNPADFPNKSGTIAEIITQLQQERMLLQQELSRVHQQIIELIPERIKLVAAYDWLSIQMQRIEAQKDCTHTSQTFLLEGWVEKEKAQAVAQALLKEYKTIEIFLSDPSDDEQPPVQLHNHPLVQPFEIVTHMYGMPHYTQVDPTPYLSPFFFLFFGICLGDAIYGMLLMLVGWFLLRKMRGVHSLKNIARLILLLGLSSCICGIFMGSWCGNALQWLPNISFGWFKNITTRVTLIDPLSQPKDATTFIIISLMLGIMHILLGMGIKCVNHIIKKDYINAFLLDLPWFLLIVCLLPILSASLFQMAIPCGVLWMSKWLAVVSAASILLFTGGVRGNIFCRLAQGGYALYGISSYLADTMSYFRLFALGLASGGIALAINSIVQIVAQSAPVIGPLCAIIIFIIGHAYNLLINLLGAFVHTCRLQFLEFFMKFFEGGGRAFAPFQIETKYIAVKPAKGLLEVKQ